MTTPVDETKHVKHWRGETVQTPAELSIPVGHHGEALGQETVALGVIADTDGAQVAASPPHELRGKEETKPRQPSRVWP